ncbi:hypothetical protein PanWU01x14_026240, partial [Parasponia andersonii]
MSIGNLTGWSRAMQPNKGRFGFMPSTSLEDYEASTDLSSVLGSTMELLESKRGKKQKKGQN